MSKRIKDKLKKAFAKLRKTMKKVNKILKEKK